MGTGETLAGTQWDGDIMLYTRSIYPLASGCSSRPASHFCWVWVEGNLDDLNTGIAVGNLQQDFTGG